MIAMRDKSLASAQLTAGIISLGFFPPINYADGLLIIN